MSPAKDVDGDALNDEAIMEDMEENKFFDSGKAEQKWRRMKLLFYLSSVDLSQTEDKIFQVEGYDKVISINTIQQNEIEIKNEWAVKLKTMMNWYLNRMEFYGAQKGSKFSK